MTCAQLFGQAVAARRKRLGLTQPDLAARLGLHDWVEISRIENGHRSLQQRTMQKIADALGCEIEITLRTKQ